MTGESVASPKVPFIDGVPAGLGEVAGQVEQGLRVVQEAWPGEGMYTVSGWPRLGMHDRMALLRRTVDLVAAGATLSDEAGSSLRECLSYTRSLLAYDVRVYKFPSDGERLAELTAIETTLDQGAEPQTAQ